MSAPDLSPAERAVVERDPRVKLLDPRIPARTTVNPVTGCWEWQGYRMPKGYGQIGFGGSVLLVHRVVWTTLHGPTRTDGFVCHHCDNPPCWNPDHLFLGDNEINTQDRVSKGRTRNGLRDKTHCRRGHLLAGANLLVDKRGCRSCRTCQNANNRRYRARREPLQPVPCSLCPSLVHPASLRRHMRNLHMEAGK